MSVRPSIVPMMFALVALAACGGGDEAAAPKTAEGAIAQAAASAAASAVTGAEVSVNLPDFAPRPPDSRAIANINVAPEGRIGGNASFTSTASMAELAAFYKAAMQQAGVPVQIESATAEMVMIGGDDAATGRSLQVMILPSGENDGSMTVSLTHSRPSSDGAQP